MDNLFTLLERAAQNNPQKIFLEAPGEADDRLHISFAETLDKVNHWAQVLIEDFQVNEHDRVAFMAPKCVEQVFMFYALWKVGAIAVPVSDTLGPEEVSFIFSDAQPKAIFCDASQFDKLKIDFSPQLFDKLDGGQTPSREPLIKDLLTPQRYDETACLIYTSGSTGRPKGVKLSHRNLMVNAISAGDKLPINSDDRFASLLPYWHSFSLTGEVILATYRQACLIFARDMREFSRLLPTWKPTIVLVVPRMLAMYRDMIIGGINAKGDAVKAHFKDIIETANQYYAPSGCLNPDPNIRLTRQAHEAGLLAQIQIMLGGQLRFFISGGAPLAPELQDFFRNINLPVYQGYGLTESSPVISANTHRNARTGSSGTMLSWLHPNFGGDWTFLTESGERGKHLEGELLVKGDCVMQGYWNHKDESAKALVDGWLHTGDMGYVIDGFLYLNGRASNLICLQGGEKVHPEHVEDVIRELDCVSEVMIIGDGCKNIYALVNKADEELEGQHVRKEIMTCIQSLAPFQRPKDLLILPHFSPSDGTMTPTLKIRRKNIHSHYADQIKAFLIANRENISL